MKRKFILPLSLVVLLVTACQSNPKPKKDPSAFSGAGTSNTSVTLTSDDPWWDPPDGSNSSVTPSGTSVTSTTPTPSTSVISTTVVPPTPTSSTSTTPVPPPPDDYYTSISDSLTGDSLKNALNSLNSSKKIRNFKYNDHKQYQQLLEIDPLGTTPSGKMIGFYDNAIISGPWDNQATWNREHVWPNSRGGSKVEGDLHMVRPTSVKINSERGNKVYGAVSDSYDPGQYCAEYRGISARIIFYCAIADKSLTLNELTTNAGNNMGILSTLLAWNLQYLPGGQNSESLALRVEWHRNETIEKNSQLQGNRNPFIDHPEYACRIWGATNNQTKAACGMN